MKNRLKMFGLVAIMGIASTLGMKGVSAADCPVSNGTATITGNALCSLTADVDTVNVSAALSELGDVLYAFDNDSSFNFDATKVTIKATVTDIFSTEGIAWLATLAPAGATVKITPGVSDIVYTSVPFQMPAGFSINYNNTNVHLPVGTSVTDAFDVFKTISGTGFAISVGNDFTINTVSGNPVINLSTGTSVKDALLIFNNVNNKEVTIAVGSKFNITTEGSSKNTTIHLNEGQDLKDIFDLINSANLDGLIVAAPDYHVNLLDNVPVIYLEGDLTEAEVLQLIAGLNVNATVKLINSTDFTVTLATGKDPVVNRLAEPELEKEPSNPGKLVSPKTSDNLLTILFVNIIAICGIAISFNKILKIKNY